AAASVLSAVVIVMFNILAVICLSVYREGKPSFKNILLDILKNPLIASIMLGLAMLLVRPYVGFRLSDITPVYKVLGNIAGLATPMALLVLGAQFEFSTVKQLRREIICGVVMRCLMVPVLGLGTAYLLFKGEFTGAHFAALTAVFTTPLAVSSVAMAQEMDGDVRLAGQLVIWTTLISALTTFVASFLLKSAGVF
ncbi:MAG: AEC family transporter, partial [Clostridia bacterium]|nr:AEC family transporter [Clostridia bacterium]